jgi:dihydroorotase
MKVILQQVVINDPRSPFHGSRQDILISDGIISNIAPSIHLGDARVISEPSLVASPGWVDPFAHFNDPGTEYRETIESGAAAAAAGGYTIVLVLPNTKPVIDSKSQVEYVVSKASRLPAQVLPIGAVTKEADGKELAEMYDMKSSGAVAFSDGIRPIQSSGLLVKALQYVKAFNGVVIQMPDDHTIAPHGLMNEGITSTRLGLPGKPMIAEELIVARDIKLARYADSHIHFTGISSPKSIDYIRRAKEGGLKVSCSVTPYHLYFCEEDLVDYDTNLKVNPPLRSRADMLALREAVKNGLVDCIATHHQPQNYDGKILEFEYAKFGMIGLETCYSVLKTAIPELSDARIAELLSINARKLFDLPEGKLEAGQTASICFHLPEKEYVFEKSLIRSKSFNSPFIGRQLKGKIVGTISGTHVTLNSSI